MHPQAEQNSESAERPTTPNNRLIHQPSQARRVAGERWDQSNPPPVTVGGLAELLGCGRLEIRHYANLLGLRFTSLRVGPRKKRIACLSAAAAAAVTAAYERDLAAIAATRSSSSSSSSSSSPAQPGAGASEGRNTEEEKRNATRTANTQHFARPGYICLLQLEPEFDPRRVQIVFNQNREGRLDQFLKSTPYARCLAQWPACASWENVAVQAIAQSATRIHSQIFDTQNPRQLIAHGQALFALLPKPELPTPDFEVLDPIENLFLLASAHEARTPARSIFDSAGLPAVVGASAAPSGDPPSREAPNFSQIPTIPSSTNRSSAENPAWATPPSTGKLPPMRLLIFALCLAFAGILPAAEKAAKAAPKATPKPAAEKPAAEKSAGPHNPRIFLVGDSIVAENDVRTGVHGWGEYFQIPGNTYSETVNRAAEARSAKTFQMEGLWTKVLAEKPDVVLIEFGHNDANLGKGTSTKALQEYRDALGRYIRGSRKAGAVPVLVTPAHSMAFDQGQLTPWIEDFVVAMKAVAETEKVPLVDLHARSGELFRTLGPDQTAQLHPAGDVIHFNELGAKAMAEIVRREIARADLKLAWKLFGTNTPLPPGVDPPTKTGGTSKPGPATAKAPKAK